eukprot:2792131-Rhodomonas_salina.1
MGRGGLTECCAGARAGEANGAALAAASAVVQAGTEGGADSSVSLDFWTVAGRKWVRRADVEGGSARNRKPGGALVCVPR